MTLRTVVLCAFAGGVLCGFAGGVLAAAANQLVDRFPRSEPLVLGIMAIGLVAVIWRG